MTPNIPSQFAIPKCPNELQKRCNICFFSTANNTFSESKLNFDKLKTICKMWQNKEILNKNKYCWNCCHITKQMFVKIK